MHARPAPLAAAFLAVALSATAAAQPAATAGDAPRAPAGPAFDGERFRHEVERLRHDAERIARDAQAQAWTMLAQAPAFEFDVEFDAPAIAFIHGDAGPGPEIVKNAPYQAEVVNESIRVLADGNRIVRKSTTAVARDGLGRTRQQSPGGRVYLSDPIARASYALDPARKSAVRIPRVPSAAHAPPAPPAPPLPAEAAAAPPAPGAAPRRVEERVMVKRTPDGREVVLGPERIVVRRGAVDGKPVEDLEVEVLRTGRGEAGAPMPALPLLPPGKGETKDLGTRDFDGVKAEGTMTTHTIPAGRIGNEKPIVVTSERWFSPELHVVVYAKTSDPRSGDTVYRLGNLRRGEPPADLFRVPPDYRVRGDR